MYTYPGNLHIHSTYSDGTGTIPEIASAAKAAGVSYIIITDHYTLKGLPEEGIYDGVAVLVGMEFNKKNCHYLAMGLSETLPSNEEQPQELINAVKAKGALGFIAHPFEKGSPYIDGGISFPWNRWPVTGFTGIEIWNHGSHWRGRTTSIPRSIYWFLINRKAPMDDGPPLECLQMWDCYTSSGERVVGIGGTDAHAAHRKVAGIPVEIFPYEFLCRTINTYIALRDPLSADFSQAKEQIYAALAAGCCYISFDQLHSGRGFSFAAYKLEDEQRAALMGEEIDYEEGLTLIVRSPSPRSLIRLIGNGRLVHQGKGSELRYNNPSPGAYRVEVYYRPLLGRPRPWLYSNPIYLKGER